MNRCRVSEEDARDPYFDGEEDITDPCSGVKERERFNKILKDIERLVLKLYSNKHFKPDTDDLEAAIYLYNELNCHTRGEEL